MPDSKTLGFYKFMAVAGFELLHKFLLKKSEEYIFIQSTPIMLYLINFVRKADLRCSTYQAVTSLFFVNHNF